MDDISKQTPRRRLSVTLVGDSAISVGVFTQTLNLEAVCSKGGIDQKLMELSLQCLDSVISAVRKESGAKYPSYDDVCRFLNKKSTSSEN